MITRKGQVQSLIIFALIIIASWYVIPGMLSDGRPLVVNVAMAVMPLFFLIALVNTNFALSILIFSMLLSPGYQLGGIPGRTVAIRLDDILLFMVFFGWMCKMAIHKELGFAKLSSLNRPIIAYVMCCLLSSAYGAVIGTNSMVQSFFYLIKYAEYFVIFFIVNNSLSDLAQAKRFVLLLVITCLIINLYGLFSYFSLGLRATAPFQGKSGEANTLAGYLLVMMSLLLGFITHSRAKYVIIGSIVLLCLCFSTFLYTLSRSGWAGFVPVYLIFLFVARRNKTFLLIMLAVAAAVSPIVVPKIVSQRVKATFVGKTIVVFGKKVKIDESAMARIDSAKYAINLWKKHPVLGYGVPGGGSVSDVQYTRVLREVGLIGFCVFAWLIISIFKVAINTYRDKDVGDFGRGLSLSLIAALAGLLLMGWGAEVFIIIRIMEPFWFLVAIVTALPQLYKQEIKDPTEPPAVPEVEYVPAT